MMYKNLMSSFDDRKKSFEKKFANDQELQFKIDSRRNKYLGEWAGKLLGKKDDQIASYIKEIIVADFEESGSDDVLKKIKKDLDNANLKVEISEIQNKISEFSDLAKKDFQ